MVTHCVNNGKDSNNTFFITNRFIMYSDTLTINVKTLLSDKNTVKTSLDFSGIVTEIAITQRNKFKQKKENYDGYLLLETCVDNLQEQDGRYYYLTTLNPVPIAAFSGYGDMSSCDYIGQVVHPKLWTEKFGMKITFIGR